MSNKNDIYSELIKGLQDEVDTCLDNADKNIKEAQKILSAIFKLLVNGPSAEEMDSKD